MRSNAVYCSRDCKVTAADRRRNANPASRIRKHARRARLLGNPGYVEFRACDFDRALRGAQGKCFYCHKLAQLEMDHVVPLARGGRHALSNIVFACKRCNASKSDLFLSEWKQRTTYPRG